MPILRLDFRAHLQPGGGNVNDRTDPHLLSQAEFVSAYDLQGSRGALEKSTAYQRLAQITPTGDSIDFSGATGEYVTFPDHADYDLGLRWTIDYGFNLDNLPSSGEFAYFHKREDGSGNEVASLKIDSSGEVFFTHRDEDDTETILSFSGVGTGEFHMVRATRFYDNMTLRDNGAASAITNSLSTTAKTKASDQAWLVGGAASGEYSPDGRVGEFRVFRDEIQDDQDYSYVEYPWLPDPRLVLYMKGVDGLDYSNNLNDGTVVGSPGTGEIIVTALNPILDIFHLKLSDGTQKWVVWASDELRVEDVL